MRFVPIQFSILVRFCLRRCPVELCPLLRLRLSLTVQSGTVNAVIPDFALAITVS